MWDYCPVDLYFLVFSKSSLLHWCMTQNCWNFVKKCEMIVRTRWATKIPLVDTHRCNNCDKREKNTISILRFRKLIALVCPQEKIKVFVVALLESDSSLLRKCAKPPFFAETYHFFYSIDWAPWVLFGGSDVWNTHLYNKIKILSLFEQSFKSSKIRNIFELMLRRDKQKPFVSW